jgi:hypothetical protein
MSFRAMQARGQDTGKTEKSYSNQPLLHAGKRLDDANATTKEMCCFHQCLIKLFIDV